MLACTRSTSHTHLRATHACCCAHARLPACVIDPPPAPSRWATEQLRRHLAASLPAAPPPPSAAATPPASAQPLAASSWPALALQQPGLLVPAALQCMPWDGVLGVVLTQQQDTIVTAAGSVTGMSCMCEMLAALGTCGYSSQVVATVRGPGRMLGVTLGADCVGAVWGHVLWQRCMHRARCRRASFCVRPLTSVCPCLLW